MSLESEKIEEQDNKVGDAFRYYRERGLFFLNTVIVFASVVLGWVWTAGIGNHIGGYCKTVFFLLGILPLALSIILGILVQFLIFKGYRWHAYYLLANFHVLLKKLEVPKGENNVSIIQAYLAEANTSFEKSNKLFSPAEKISFINLILFLLGFVTIFIFISIDFFNN